MSKVAQQQRTIGIIGGMSWESTQTYYQLINQGIKRELGGLHSADILLHSLDFAPIAELQAENDWEAMADVLVESGLRLKAAGAQGILIATNTMHKVADEVQTATGLPLIHIADATAAAIKAAGISKIALLGTNFTMTQDFYKQRLVDAGLTVMVPEESERNEVHRIIYKELCQGQFTDESRRRYVAIIAQLAEQGAEGVILGCTEIGLLIQQADSPIPVFDTTRIHAEAAVEFLLQANNQGL
jgi:aspartate racemase